MKTGVKILIIIAAIILGLAMVTAIAVPIFTESDYYREYVTLKNESLSKYKCSSAGDMLGSYYGEVIEPYDENKAILTVSKQEYHNSDTEIKKYLLDKQVLEDIEKVFRKYHMNRWDGRRISNIFVCDGATDSYSFYFGDEDFSFSSQSFPGKYGKGVNEIEEAINKYDKELIEQTILPNENE